MRKFKICKGACTTPIAGCKETMAMKHFVGDMVSFYTYTQTPRGESIIMEWEPMTTAELKAIYNLITTGDE